MVVLEGPPQWTVLATFGPAITAFAVSRAETGSYKCWQASGGSLGWIRYVCEAAVGVALVVLAYVVLPGMLTADPT